MSRIIYIVLLVLVALEVAVAPPVDGKKKDETKKDKEVDLDDFGLEYGRYLQQVVQALEEDKEFAKKLENISAEQIRTGHIAKELEFVKHNVRSKLDELKRIEVDRLRKLIQEQMERTELGLNRKGIKIPKHLEIENPHSFEIEDLKKLIQTATSDLEEIDKKRREEFKKYELEKEAAYRDKLKHGTEEERKEEEKHHQELLEKHKDHPKIHHPGSKPQLEQVWEEQDHMPKEDFNPKTFFAMHDINGDGHLDVEEVEALLIPEVRKLYNPNNEEDDPAEMEEEFHRMREHIFNETDKNKDSLISLDEFMKMTEQQEFQQDEGWKGLDEQPVFSEAELEEYMRQRQMQPHPDGQYYGDQRMYYDVGGQHGAPPHPDYQQGQYGAPPQGYPHPQQFQQGQVPQQQFQQGHAQQFQQGHPQQFQQGHPQQFQQGHPQQFQQGYPQQGQAPSQQFHQGQAPPQQFHQGQVPPQQFHQGQAPPQQFHQGQAPPKQQFQQGQVPQQQQQLQQGHRQQGQAPPQQFHQGQAPPQQQGQAPPQQFQQGQVPPQQQNPQGQVPQQPIKQADVPLSSQVPAGNVPGEQVAAAKASSLNQAPSKTQEPAVPPSAVVHP